jgi:hypothetical protein
MPKRITLSPYSDADQFLPGSIIFSLGQPAAKDKPPFPCLAFPGSPFPGWFFPGWLFDFTAACHVPSSPYNNLS